MKTFIIFTTLVAAAAAFPMGNNVALDGQFVLAKDYSNEDGTEYSVKYVKPYTPGQRMPRFDLSLDSSEEVFHFLASQQEGGQKSWAERVRSLQQVLNTGLDVSDELFHRMHSTGINLPTDRQYFVDSSGEIYYDKTTKQKPGGGVRPFRK
ncbi:uncharacterized protein LOC127003523 [Eriocheir sinensis]|uniref:uncharacterized protein LOC127003523 n=1 Tax=Eriocheir sinensis TaxID=95602 RepID=UPI0021CA661E|nr:uncharacterized protein LOC127003523 [Eriocheir sinensis]